MKEREREKERDTDTTTKKQTGAQCRRWTALALSGTGTGGAGTGELRRFRSRAPPAAGRWAPAAASAEAAAGGAPESAAGRPEWPKPPVGRPGGRAASGNRPRRPKRRPTPRRWRRAPSRPPVGTGRGAGACTRSTPATVPAAPRCGRRAAGSASSASFGNNRRSFSSRSWHRPLRSLQISLAVSFFSTRPTVPSIEQRFGNSSIGTANDVSYPT